MVVGGAAVQRGAVAQGGGGHGGGGSVQLTHDGGVAVRPAGPPCRRGTSQEEATGAVPVAVAVGAAGNAGISSCRRDAGGTAGRLVVESLLGNERGRVRYGGTEARSGA